MIPRRIAIDPPDDSLLDGVIILQASDPEDGWVCDVFVDEGVSHVDSC